MATADKILAKIERSKEPFRKTLILILDYLSDNKPIESRQLQDYLLSNYDLAEKTIKYTIRKLRELEIEKQKVELLRITPDLLDMRRCYYTIYQEYREDKELNNGIKSMLKAYI